VQILLTNDDGITSRGLFEAKLRWSGTARSP
jgi:broad specificity polyphosphatase/5'/3'-nucleotidase SurE